MPLARRDRLPAGIALRYVRIIAGRVGAVIPILRRRVGLAVAVVSVIRRVVAPVIWITQSPPHPQPEPPPPAITSTAPVAAMPCEPTVEPATVEPATVEPATVKSAAMESTAMESTAAAVKSA